MSVEMERIREFVDRLAREFRPERVILFGSHADGSPTADSDVDILVVIPHEGKSWKMAVEIRKRVRPHFPLDLIVRSPEQIRARLALGDCFIRDVTENGRVLYERDLG